MPASSTLDAVRRRYNFPDLFIASWRDPALSVHPARGGPGSPGVAAYKVNYDLLTQPEDDEPLGGDENDSGTAEVNIDQSVEFESNEWGTAGQEDFDLPSGDLSPHQDTADSLESEVHAQSESTTAEVVQADTELDLDNMSASEDSSSSPSQENNDEFLPEPGPEVESGATDPNETPDDASEDRRVSFAPGTPDPKPTSRKKKTAKGAKGKKKRIAVPLDSLPADVMAMIDGVFDGQPPPAPDPPTDGATAERDELQGSAHAPEESRDDDAQHDEPPKEEAPPSPPSAGDVPDASEAVTETLDVAPLVDGPDTTPTPENEQSDELIVPTNGQTEATTAQPASADEPKEDEERVEPAIMADEPLPEPAVELSIPNSGVDVLPISEKSCKKRSSKSSKDKEKSKKKSSKVRNKELPQQPVGLGIDVGPPAMIISEVVNESTAPSATEDGGEGQQPAEGSEPNVLANESNDAPGTQTETAEGAEKVELHSIDGEGDQAAPTSIPPPRDAPKEAATDESEATEVAKQGIQDEPQAIAEEGTAATEDQAQNDEAKDLPPDGVVEAKEPPEEEPASTDIAASPVDSAVNVNDESEKASAEDSKYLPEQEPEQAAQIAEPGDVASDGGHVQEDVPLDGEDGPAVSSESDGEEDVGEDSLAVEGLAAEKFEDVQSLVGDVSESALAAEPVVESMEVEEVNETEQCHGNAATLAEEPAVEPMEVQEMKKAEQSHGNAADSAECEGDAEGTQISIEQENPTEGDTTAGDTVMEDTTTDPAMGGADIDIAETNEDGRPPEVEPVQEARALPKASKNRSQDSHRRKADSWKRKNTAKPLKEASEHATVLQRPHDRDQRSKNAVRVKRRDSGHRRSSTSADEQEERRRRRDARKAEESARRAEEERRRAESEERRRARRADRRAAEAAARLEEQAAALEAEARRLRDRGRRADISDGRKNKVKLPSFMLPSIPKALNLTSSTSVHSAPLVTSNGKTNRPSSKGESRSTEENREPPKTASPPVSNGDGSRRRHRQHPRGSGEDGDRSHRRQRDPADRPRRYSVDQNTKERPRSFFGSLVRKV